MELISAAYSEGIKQMMRYAKADMTITEQNVLQESNKDILPFIDKMLDGLVLPGSCVRGAEHLADLMDKAKAGSSCLLLLEHYSNFDLPVFSYLLRKDAPRGQEIADAIIAIAGMKLNEEHPVVAAFTSAYSRIVIYPSRSLEKLDPETARTEILRSNSINRAAMKALNDVKKEGKLVLVFPAGTRFRPWEPQTKRGVREIDSYIKSFDYMCLVSINGDVLRIQQGKMTDDQVVQDVIVMEAGPVVSCAEFRDKAKNAVPEDGDRKQAVVDAIMARLEEMHVKNVSVRESLLKS
jgi:glycerol-3-phosphate O-acyltransferase